MGVGGSSSSSSPVNMTPKAFKELQGPFASVFASLLGFGPPGGPSNGTGWGPNPNGSGYVQNPAGGQVSANGMTNGGMQFGGTGGTSGTSFGQGYTRPGGKNNIANLQSGNPFGLTWEQFGASKGYGSAGAGGSGSSGGGSGGVDFSNLSSDPNDILNGIPKYRGPLTAEIGSNEQALLDMLMGNANGTGSSTGTAGPTAGAQDYLQRVMNGDFMPGGASQGGLTSFAQMLKGSQQQAGYGGTMDEMNPYLQASIEAAQRPTLQGLEETLSRTLPGRFTEAGQFKQPGGSSAFDRAAAIASRGASDSLADIATNLSYATYEAERGRTFQAQEGARQREDTALQSELDRIFQGREGERGRQNEAAGLTSTIQTQEVDNLVKNLQAQALPRLIQEFGIERGLEQFNNQMNSLLATLGIAQGVTAPVIGNKSESSSAQLSLK